MQIVVKDGMTSHSLTDFPEPRKNRRRSDSHGMSVQPQTLFRRGPNTRTNSIPRPVVQKSYPCAFRHVSGLFRLANRLDAGSGKRVGRVGKIHFPSVHCSVTNGSERGRNNRAFLAKTLSNFDASSCSQAYRNHHRRPCLDLIRWIGKPTKLVKIRTAQLTIVVSTATDHPQPRLRCHALDLLPAPPYKPRHAIAIRQVIKASDETDSTRRYRAPDRFGGDSFKSVRDDMDGTTHPHASYVVFVLFAAYREHTESVCQQPFPATQD